MDSQQDAAPRRLFEQLQQLRADLVAYAESHRDRIELVHPEFQESAVNLLHYLALRRQDLRALQESLAKLGLSSLGRAEAHVLPTLDAILAALSHWAAPDTPSPRVSEAEFERGEMLLRRHSDALLGPPRPERGARIMVTMPSEAATDPTLIPGLVDKGMDLLRINCAHDGPAEWHGMIENLRRSEQETSRSCRVVMDLAGPKLRTGPVEQGPRVVKLRPSRDPIGRVVKAARAFLYDEDGGAVPPGLVGLPVPASWLGGLVLGDVLKVRDARGKRRTWTVTQVAVQACVVEAARTSYVISGTKIRRTRVSAPKSRRSARVGELPALEGEILLRRGDLLVVTADQAPGRAARRGPSGESFEAHIGCTIPEVFEDVRVGQAVWFDDGKLGGSIEEIQPGRMVVRIERAGLRGSKLRADKGINLPDSALRLPALTDDDRHDLPFVARHADVVELSFANSAADVASLQESLAALGGTVAAIVLKIETRRGFENLPEMLLMAMRSPCFGVMIARGDLAVECGFERLAEVQEEILWVCEAAHVPVIWATQVLESLAKKGLPSRAEISDAALSNRAECVMLNKGPHVFEAAQALDNILRRMQDHQAKKRSMLRELRLAHALRANNTTQDEEP